MRCLIVDDNARFRDVARVLLEREGVSVVGVAATGADAVRRVAQLRPDVVLLDIDLGPESGFEVLGRLRRADGPVRVILISAHAEDDYADLIAASPAVGFLPKLGLSARAIRDLLDRRGGADQLDRVSGPRGT